MYVLAWIRVLVHPAAEDEINKFKKVSGCTTKAPRESSARKRMQKESTLRLLFLLDCIKPKI